MKNLIFSAIVEFIFVKDILTIFLYNAYLQLNKLHTYLIQPFSSKTSIGAHQLIFHILLTVFLHAIVKFINTRETIKFPQLTTINTHTICVMQFR